MEITIYCCSFRASDFNVRKPRRSVRTYLVACRKNIFTINAWNIGNCSLSSNVFIQSDSRNCSRPLLVISNDIGNKHSPTVIIAAITSRVRKKKKLPTHLYLGQIEGLPANSIILFEQLRTIDKSRLKEHLTHLDEQYLKSLEFPLLISIGVEKRRSL